MNALLIKIWGCLIFLMSVVHAHSFPTMDLKIPGGGLEKPMVIVVCSYNNSTWYQKNLNSVFAQNYQNFIVLYIDDCSTDGTGLLVEQYLQDHGLSNRCILIKNEQRLFKMANLYKAYHMCPDEVIIVELDGDDWLPHDDVLTLINKTYLEYDAWMTYGHYIGWPNNISSEAFPHVFKTTIPQDVIDANAFRKMEGNIWSGLRTYYAWLVKQIKLQDLLYKSNWLPRTSDAAIFYPMFEMAGSRFKFIDHIILVHNEATPLNDHKVDAKLQYALELYIRQLTPYKRIDVQPQISQRMSVCVLICEPLEYIDMYHIMHDKQRSISNCLRIHDPCSQNDFAQYLLQALNSVSDGYILLLQDSGVLHAIDTIDQQIALLQQTKARGVFYTLHEDELCKDGLSVVSLMPHMKAWQFGFTDQKLLDVRFALNALYPKQDLIDLVRSHTLHSCEDLAQKIITSLLPLEVGIFVS